MYERPSLRDAIAIYSWPTYWVHACGRTTSSFITFVVDLKMFEVMIVTSGRLYRDTVPLNVNVGKTCNSKSHN